VPALSGLTSWTVPSLALSAGSCGTAAMALSLAVLSSTGFAAPMAPAMRCSAPAISMKIEGMVGDCAPLGFFDPLGFSKDASPETMKKFREAELKHGRVAMLACFGMISADATSLFPRVFNDFSSNPLAAVTQTPKLGWLQIGTFIMFIEVLGIINSRRPDYEPGNFLGTSQWEMDATWESYQTKELNNGRLAMFGAIGMLTGSYITGQGPLEVMTGGGMVVF